MMNALTNADQDRVMLAVNAALKQDAPNASYTDVLEFAYQMASIAATRWPSVAGTDAALINQVRAAPQYQKLLQRLSKTGTVYADVQDRALSPYALFDRGGSSFNMTQLAYPIGGAALGYFAFKRNPMMGALIGAVAGYVIKTYALKGR